MRNAYIIDKIYYKLNKLYQRYIPGRLHSCPHKEGSPGNPVERAAVAAGPAAGQTPQEPP